MTNTVYEAVIGLEVHAELRTESKVFCSCSTAFGAEPNTQCCPICMAFPGTMPMLNRRAVELGVTAGLALGCEISPYSRMDRKQYVYPDLPKSYQISQDGTPLCYDGGITVSTEQGEKRIGIVRVHIEEDAGKLFHRGEHTYLDCNRCGVPLIEIVSAPDIRSAEEASAFLRKLRGILLTCGVSNCRMQEGSLRCDINLSLREAGSTRLGVRTEIKNLNSFAFAEKAIRYEIARQTALLASGGEVLAETRRFDPTSGKTIRMRTKERAVDYRFLPEPDLAPISVSEATVERLRNALPELPDVRAARLVGSKGLSPYDASVLVSDPSLADYYESAAVNTAYPKLLVNLLLSDLMHYCGNDPFTAPVSAERLASLADLLGEGVINSSTAKKLLLRLVASDFDPRETVSREGLAQLRDPRILSELVQAALQSNPRAVADYQNGKKAALRALQGQAMAQCAGRADPILLKKILLDALSAHTEN